MPPINSMTENTPAAHRYSENNEPLQTCQGKTLDVLSNKSEKYKLFVYHNCVEFKTIKFQSPEQVIIHKKRGAIHEFSKISRFRLLTLLAKCSSYSERTPVFVTLTYHYGHERKFNDTKYNLHHFFVKMRQFDSDCAFIWRVEIQKRGAPHYHLIIWPGENASQYPLSIFITALNTAWHEVADPNSNAHKEYGCKVVKIRSYREACVYLSKYIAKKDDEGNTSGIGKHWGNSRNIPIQVQQVKVMNRNTAEVIIEKLRSFLFNKGKKQYADSSWFNVDRDQTVFISQEEFEELLDSYEFPDMIYKKSD